MKYILKLFLSTSVILGSLSVAIGSIWAADNIEEKILTINQEYIFPDTFQENILLQLRSGNHVDINDLSWVSDYSHLLPVAREIINDYTHPGITFSFSTLWLFGTLEDREFIRSIIKTPTDPRTIDAAYAVLCGDPTSPSSFTRKEDIIIAYPILLNALESQQSSKTFDIAVTVWYQQNASGKDLARDIFVKTLIDENNKKRIHAAEILFSAETKSEQILARNFLNEVIQDPKHSNAYIAALTLSYSGDKDDQNRGKETLRIIAEDPEHPHALNAAIRFYWDRNEEEKIRARPVLIQALQGDSNDITTYNIAQALWHHGNKNDKELYALPVLKTIANTQNHPRAIDAAVMLSHSDNPDDKEYAHQIFIKALQEDLNCCSIYYAALAVWNKKDECGRNIARPVILRMAKKNDHIRQSEAINLLCASSDLEDQRIGSELRVIHQDYLKSHTFS